MFETKKNWKTQFPKRLFSRNMIYDARFSARNGKILYTRTHMFRAIARCSGIFKKPKETVIWLSWLILLCNDFNIRLKNIMISSSNDGL